MEKMLWDHFDAIEMARFLGSSAEAVKRMSPRDLMEATQRQIAFNARERRKLPGANDSAYPRATSLPKGS